MLRKIGAEGIILRDGLDSLPGANRPAMTTSPAAARQLAKSVLRARWYPRLLKRLRGVDAIVVVQHMPMAFQAQLFDDVRLRADLPETPVILYDLVYLPTRGPWARRLLTNDRSAGVPPGRHWGMDRYDHHLCVTEVSPRPVPRGFEDFTRIGVDLDVPELNVEPGRPLTALIDFERKDHLPERELQLRALQRAGIPWRVLSGEYPAAEIRAIYRQCGLYFLAHRESFGLPICETQACGALVFAPFHEWCPSHMVRGINGETGLPRNFVIYNNDEDTLVGLLLQKASSFDAMSNRRAFETCQPHFLRGDLDALAHFVERLRNGAIHSKSHAAYPDLATLAQRISELGPDPYHRQA